MFRYWSYDLQVYLTREGAVLALKYGHKVDVMALQTQDRYNIFSTGWSRGPCLRSLIVNNPDIIR